jgi:hypothetical protein
MSEGLRARRQLFEDELPVGRPTEKLDNVGREWFAWDGAALALDEILDLASLLALLEKVLRWVHRDERQLGNRLAHVLRVVL